MLQWSVIYCFNPKLRLCFVRNWVLLYINENENRCAQLISSSYYRFTFLCLSFRHLVQKKKKKKLFKYYEYQLPKRCLEGRLEGFKVSSWYLKIMKLVEDRIAYKCHDFHYCCRWLHHHYSRGCHVWFYFNKTVFNSDDLILKGL